MDNKRLSDVLFVVYQTIKHPWNGCFFASKLTVLLRHVEKTVPNKLR